jgi:protoporphyrinogen oxidase
MEAATDRSHLVILGGGATGMAAAYFAARRGLDVTLIESSPRLGGLLRTFPVGGTRLECFYHHFFTHDSEIHEFLSDLGLSKRIAYAPTRMGLYRGGRAHLFTTAKDLLRLPGLSLFDKLRFALTSLYLSRQRDWCRYEDVALLGWFERWCGKAVTDMIWRPMLEIKFGNLASRIPVAWMIGRLSQRLRSRRKGREELGYLDGSLQLLVDTLEERLIRMGVRVLKGMKVDGIESDAERVTGVIAGGARLPSTAVLSTLPLPKMAQLLGGSSREYRREIESIAYFGAICVVVVTARPLSDIYWLNIADPGFIFGGIIEQTNLLPPSHYGGLHITYLSRYTEPGHDLMMLSDEELVTRFLADLRRVHPSLSASEVLHAQVFRTDTAAPVCGLGFSRTRPGMNSPIPGLFLANMTHVYPDERSVNNSIRVGREAVEAVDDFFQRSR